MQPGGPCFSWMCIIMVSWGLGENRRGCSWRAPDSLFRCKPWALRFPEGDGPLTMPHRGAPESIAVFPLARSPSEAWVVRPANEGEEPLLDLVMKPVEVSLPFGTGQVKVSMNRYLPRASVPCRAHMPRARVGSGWLVGGLSAYGIACQAAA